jgi:peptidyl-prolyl cis-trans isomerase SurA
MVSLMNTTLTTKYLLSFLIKSTLFSLSLMVFFSCSSIRKTKSVDTATPPDLSTTAIFAYGQDSVIADDFRYVFLKNNRDSIEGLSATALREALTDYLDLYINFKLKVKAAYDANMDEEQAFVQEFAQYRNQLAKPYMVENRFKEQMITEAYQRMSEEINASHILVAVPEGTRDTLKYYQKADSLRQLAEQGASFSMLAEEFSDDPSAPQNGGNLGYFSSMQMVYPFENAAYSTPEGAISPPVRTRFGYHVIKVHDRRATQGNVKVAHIMIRHPEGQPGDKSSEAYMKAQQIYQELQQGGDWKSLTERFSDDLSTRSSGGELPYFGTGGMLKEFEDAAFSLKNTGDVSQPVSTRYGWHLIKLLDRKGLAPMDEMRSLIERKVQRVLQGEEMQDEMLSMLKNENEYRQQNMNVRNTILYMSAGPEVAKPAPQTILFSVRDTSFTFSTLEEYLRKQEVQLPLSKAVAEETYQSFEEEKMISYEEAHLAEKYPDFRLLLQEYKEGILLFNIMEKKIWQPSNDDVTGLNAYYRQHQDEYQWKKRVEATIIDARNEAILQSVLAKLDEGKLSSEKSTALEQEFNEDSPLNLQIYADVYEESAERSKAESVIDRVEWKEGSYSISENGRAYQLIIHEVMPPRGKSLEEVKGMVIADYQKELEEAWVEQLRGIYPVQVDDNVVEALIQQIQVEHE